MRKIGQQWFENRFWKKGCLCCGHAHKSPAKAYDCALNHAVNYSIIAALLTDWLIWASKGLEKEEKKQVQRFLKRMPQ
jgi:hypothetical protein